jgi:hypothetical protein
MSVINPFQSIFSANHILPSSYLFIPAIFLQAQLRKYNAQSPVHNKTHRLPRNRKSTTCAICLPKSVLHEDKRRKGSNSGAGATKTCQTPSDIRAEQENHNVGQGPTQDRKGLTPIHNLPMLNNGSAIWSLFWDTSQSCLHDPLPQYLSHAMYSIQNLKM